MTTWTEHLEIAAPLPEAAPQRIENVVPVTVTLSPATLPGRRRAASDAVGALGDESPRAFSATLYTVYFPARETAGLPKLRWHDLRHFVATQAAIAGATTRELMTLLGHSVPNAAMRYQQVANGRLEDIAARV